MATYTEEAMRRAMESLNRHHQRYPIWKPGYDPFQKKEPEMGCIYLLTDKLTGKRYVGQAKYKDGKGNNHGLEGRWKKHVSNAMQNRNQCKLLEKAIREHGPENFERNIIDQAEVGFDLDRLEEHYIRTLHTRYPNGYNIVTTKRQGARKGARSY